MKRKKEQRVIRTNPCPHCRVCGARGKILYEGLRDCLFGAPGVWNFKQCPNPGCGLIWLDPMPLKEDIGIAYQHYYTHHDISTPSNTWARRAYDAIKDGYVALRYGYPDTPTWKKLLGMLIYLHPGRRADFDFSVMYLPAYRKGDLLEVGCGSGEMLTRIQGLGWHVEGVDFDSCAVQNARSKGLRVQLGTLEEQSYPDNHFDVITMSHTIEHVYDPVGNLRESYRILKDGGQLVLVTPNNESLGHKSFRAAWRGLEVPRHLYLFSAKVLQKLSHMVGFRSSNVKVTIRNARGIYLASHALQRAEGNGKGEAFIPNPNVKAEIWQLMEWVLCRINPNLGEEIILLAVK